MASTQNASPMLVAWQLADSAFPAGGLNHSCVKPSPLCSHSCFVVPSSILACDCDVREELGALNPGGALRQGLEAAMQSGRVGCTATLKMFAVEMLHLQVHFFTNKGASQLRRALWRPPHAMRTLVQITCSHRHMLLIPPTPVAHRAYISK